MTFVTGPIWMWVNVDFRTWGNLPSQTVSTTSQIRHNCCFYDRERHLSYICLSPYLSSLLVSCFGNLSASIWHHQVHWPGGCLPCWQQSSTHGAPNSAGANGMVADSVNLERQSFTSWGLCYFGWPCGGQQLWCCTPTFDGAKFWKTWHVSTFKRKGKHRRPKWRWWVSNIFNGSLVREKTQGTWNRHQQTTFWPEPICINFLPSLSCFMVP